MQFFVLFLGRHKSIAQTSRASISIVGDCEASKELTTFTEYHNLNRTVDIVVQVIQQMIPVMCKLNRQRPF